MPLNKLIGTNLLSHYLGRFTGLTDFLDRFPGKNKTVMPLKLSREPLHTVLNSTCKTKIREKKTIGNCLKICQVFLFADLTYKSSIFE